MRENLEAERARRGMTKTALAEQLGISGPTLLGYVNGAPIPSNKLEDMANLFGVSTDYILGRTAKRTPPRA